MLYRLEASNLNYNDRERSDYVKERAVEVVVGSTFSNLPFDAGQG